MTRHQEPMTTRSTALLQQIEGGVLGRYRSCLFSGHDTPPAQLTLPLPSVYHLHSQFATLEKKTPIWKMTLAFFTSILFGITSIMFNVGTSMLTSKPPEPSGNILLTLAGIIFGSLS